jgi:hypothetical protein
LAVAAAVAVLAAAAQAVLEPQPMLLLLPELHTPFKLAARDRAAVLGRQKAVQAPTVILVSARLHFLRIDPLAAVAAGLLATQMLPARMAALAAAAELIVARHIQAALVARPALQQHL